MATTIKNLVKWTVPIHYKFSRESTYRLEEWVIEYFRGKLGRFLFSPSAGINDPRTPYIQFKAGESKCETGRNLTLHPLEHPLLYQNRGRGYQRIKESLVHEMSHCLGLTHEFFHLQFPYDFPAKKYYSELEVNERSKKLLDELDKIELETSGATVPRPKPTSSEAPAFSGARPTREMEQLRKIREADSKPSTIDTRYRSHIARTRDHRREEDTVDITTYCDVSSVMMYEGFRKALRALYPGGRGSGSDLRDSGETDRTVLSVGDLAALRSLYGSDVCAAEIEARTQAAATVVGQAVGLV